MIAVSKIAGYFIGDWFFRHFYEIYSGNSQKQKKWAIGIVQKSYVVQNKIEGTPILKLAMVKEWKIHWKIRRKVISKNNVKKQLQKTTSKNNVKKIEKFIEKFV